MARANQQETRANPITLSPDGNPERWLVVRFEDQLLHHPDLGHFVQFRPWKDPGSLFQVNLDPLGVAQAFVGVAPGKPYFLRFRKAEGGHAVDIIPLIDPSVGSVVGLDDQYLIGLAMARRCQNRYRDVFGEPLDQATQRIGTTMFINLSRNSAGGEVSEDLLLLTSLVLKTEGWPVLKEALGDSMEVYDPLFPALKPGPERTTTSAPEGVVDGVSGTKPAPGRGDPDLGVTPAGSPEVELGGWLDGADLLLTGAPAATSVDPAIEVADPQLAGS